MTLATTGTGTAMAPTAARQPGRTLSYGEAINEALHLAMARDPRVIVLGEDVAGGAGTHLGGDEAWGGAYGVTKGLARAFGRERVRDTPISEMGFVGAAIGAAVTGMRPVVELMFADFFGICFDQIYNQGAKMRYMLGGTVSVPLVIRTAMGGGGGAAAQHSGCYYSVFAHMPGLKVVAPSTPADAKGLLLAAIADDDIVAFFEHKGLYRTLRGAVGGDEPIPLGLADVKRAGRDATVVAISRMVHVALQAAEDLAGEGVEVEVIDPRTLAPLDLPTILASVRRTGRLIVVDEDHPHCSLASEIAARTYSEAFGYLDAPVELVTPPHTPVPCSPSLEAAYLPDAGRVAAAVRRAMGIA